MVRSHSAKAWTCMEKLKWCAETGASPIRSRKIHVTHFSRCQIDISQGCCHRQFDMVLLLSGLLLRLRTHTSISCRGNVRRWRFMERSRLGYRLMGIVIFVMLVLGLKEVSGHAARLRLELCGWVALPSAFLIKFISGWPGVDVLTQ